MEGVRNADGDIYTLTAPRSGWGGTVGRIRKTVTDPHEDMVDTLDELRAENQRLVALGTEYKDAYNAARKQIKEMEELRSSVISRLTLENESLRTEVERLRKETVNKSPATRKLNLGEGVDTGH